MPGNFLLAQKKVTKEEGPKYDQACASGCKVWIESLWTALGVNDCNPKSALLRSTLNEPLGLSIQTPQLFAQVRSYSGPLLW
jgi:hypothetical protein